MLSVHERVSKQDESEWEIKEEIIEKITAQGSKILAFRRGKFSCLCVEMQVIDGPLDLERGYSQDENQATCNPHYQQDLSIL